MVMDQVCATWLLVSSSRKALLINYKDQDSRFMFNFGDGAGRSCWSGT
jgi:hypothetical protein